MTKDNHQLSCKVCGCADKFDYHVSDELWERVVPGDFRNQVVCLSCFDRLANERGVDYGDEIQTLYFAGDAASMTFEKD